MEFSGNIQFADEGSWLTLTTDSDDPVTIAVSLTHASQGTEAMSFSVTPNSGVVRLPAGEIIRSLAAGGDSVVTGGFTATQGSGTCTHPFTALVCRRFSFTDIHATLLTTRPGGFPVYAGDPDRISFYNPALGATAAYVRFVYSGGSVSSSYQLTVTVLTKAAMESLDVSCDTMLSLAAAKGLSTAYISGYEVWLEHSGNKSDVYSFSIRRSRLPLKTYKFLGRRGAYEYVHADGKFSRSVESETRVFVMSGSDRELDNDSTMGFEQNSGHIGSAGLAGYWLDFLASKERYVIAEDGTEQSIVVDESKTSLSDRSAGSLTFKWHYADRSSGKEAAPDVSLRGMMVTGPETVADVGTVARFGVVYVPTNTTQRGVTWSLVEDGNYAKIDQTGLLTVLDTTGSPLVKVVATSSVNTSVKAERTVRIITALDPYISFDKDTIEIPAAAGSVANSFISRNLKNLSVAATGGVVLTSSPKVENGCVVVSFAASGEPYRKTCSVVLAGERTDGLGTYSKEFLLVQAAADVESLPLRMEIDTDGDTTLAYGESLDVTCSVYRGWDDKTSGVVAWKIERDSGDALADAAWALTDKARNFAGSITIVHTEAYSDLAAVGVSTVFTMTATLSDGSAADYTLEI